MATTPGAPPLGNLRKAPAASESLIRQLNSKLPGDAPASPFQDDGPPTAGGTFSRAKAKASTLPNKVHPFKAPSQPEEPEIVVANPMKQRAQMLHYRIYCKSNRNNTIVTFTDHAGNPRAWSSGGHCGFKGTRGSTPEAAYAAIMKVIAKVTAAAEQEEFLLDIYLNGFGAGRSTLITTLASPEGDMLRPLLTRLTDRTPIKIGGTRAKKERRV